jgi:general stress protein 26
MPEASTADVPTADRPSIPAEYGVSRRSKEYVDWSHIEQRLNEARVYWVATAGRDGHPRVRPVDGLYLDGVIYVGGSQKSRWVRDLVENPHVAVHLDGLDDVVIVEGDVELVRAVDDEQAQRLADASNAKFGYGQTADDYRKGPGFFAIRPRKVIAWTNFGKNPTRFRFERSMNGPR